MKQENITNNIPLLFWFFVLIYMHDFFNSCDIVYKGLMNQYEGRRQILLTPKNYLAPLPHFSGWGDYNLAMFCIFQGHSHQEVPE